MSALSRPAALDPADALDGPLEEALADARKAGKPTRISIVLRLYHPHSRHYVQWPGLNWRVEIGEVAEGRRIVAAIDRLLQALEVDAEGTLTALADLVDRQGGA